VELLLYGAGGQAKNVIATILALDSYQIKGILDDDQDKHHTSHYGVDVLGGREMLARLNSQSVMKFVVSIGDNRTRSEITGLMKDEGYEPVKLIHPDVILLPGCSIGKGSVVFPASTIGSDVTVGDGSIIGIGSVISHDARVGDFVHIAPNVTLNGGAVVGNQTLVGSGAVILPYITVGENVIVGANSLVNRDLPSGVTAVGSPARIIKRRQHEH